MAAFIPSRRDAEVNERALAKVREDKARDQAIRNLMEDAATAEISRSQVWQWVFNAATLDTGEVVTRELELVRAG